MKLNNISNSTFSNLVNFPHRLLFYIAIQPQDKQVLIHPKQRLELINSLHTIQQRSANLSETPINFHRRHLSVDEGVKHSLGEKFLDRLLETIHENKDFQLGMRVIIPFGGPGSMAVYLSHKNIPSLSGDINYREGTLYGTADERLNSAKKNPHAKADLISFQYWDATKLPLEDKTQDLMIINPPYGIECKLFSHKKEQPEQLLRDSLSEVKRVLKTNGVAYLFWPSDYMNKISDIKKDFNFKEEIIQGNNLRLSLVRLEKHG